MSTHTRMRERAHARLRRAALLGVVRRECATPLICAASMPIAAFRQILTEQLLGDHAAEGVADHDRQRVERTDHAAAVLGHLLDPVVGDGVGIRACRLDGVAVARPAGRAFPASASERGCNISRASSRFGCVDSPTSNAYRERRLIRSRYERCRYSRGTQRRGDPCPDGASVAVRRDHKGRRAVPQGTDDRPRDVPRTRGRGNASRCRVRA